MSINSLRRSEWPLKNNDEEQRVGATGRKRKYRAGITISRVAGVHRVLTIYIWRKPIGVKAIIVGGHPWRGCKGERDRRRGLQVVALLCPDAF